MLSMWNEFEPSVPRKALVRERIVQTIRNEAGVTGREHGASGGLGAGCVMRKEERIWTTTHRGTDSQHPWQKRGPVESCGGQGLSRGTCEGPRAGSWRQRNSSLNENIKSKMGISPSSAQGEDAVDGGRWTWQTTSSRLTLRPACVLSILSNHPCLYGSQQPTLLSAVNLVWPHISDKSHSVALSLKGIFFCLFSLQREHRGAYAFYAFYTRAADVNFKTLLHSSCRSYSLSKQEKDIHHSNYPTAPVYRNL